MRGLEEIVAANNRAAQLGVPGASSAIGGQGVKPVRASAYRRDGKGGKELLEHGDVFTLLTKYSTRISTNEVFITTD